jgi:hypothetical protein
MAIQYTWSIPTVEHDAATGGIFCIHWRCTGVDGDYSASSYGTTSHTPDASAAGFIAYNNVTEANCIAWAQAQVDKAEVEAAIAAKIDADKNPTSASGTPWA